MIYCILITNPGKGVREGHSHILLVGMYISITITKNSVKAPQKKINKNKTNNKKINLPHDPVIQLLDNYPKEMPAPYRHLSTCICGCTNSQLSISIINLGAHQESGVYTYIQGQITNS